MLSQPHNRVKAIKSKFENLNNEVEPLIVRKKSTVSHLSKQSSFVSELPTFDLYQNDNNATPDKEHETYVFNIDTVCNKQVKPCKSDNVTAKPNASYLYNHTKLKRNVSDGKKSLTRQTSDPGKKLHRSHAFRCDRSQKIGHSPKRHGSCNGRSESGDFTLKMEGKLSKDKLKRLGNFLEDQMRKDNYVPLCSRSDLKLQDSVPDSDVPQHILDQYAKVLKPKKKEEKQDAMTDSGVSSETENVEDDKLNRIQKLKSHFESDEPETTKKTNLEQMNDLTVSSDTIKLEKKNPHLILTDTLKKALKQPLPAGPPPKKPPRTFNVTPIPESPEKSKKDARQMLEKLEQILHQREQSANKNKNGFDVVETNLSPPKPKEMHYLCTEILDITNKTLLPNHSPSNALTNCLNTLNCAITNDSLSSLPYARLSTGSINRNSFQRNSINICNSCSTENLAMDAKRRLSTFSNDKPLSICTKCTMNSNKDNYFKCHLSCKCKITNSSFYVEKEHIYDEPWVDKQANEYGSLNKVKHSKSLEDLRSAVGSEDQQIYDIPCDISIPETPEPSEPPDTPEPVPQPTTPKNAFEKLRQNFENGFQNENNTKMERPIFKPKPILVKTKMSRSTETIDDDKFGDVKKFSTEVKKSKRERCETKIGFTLPKKETAQFDVDRENLNRLMNEIYDTVTSCNMENKPESFPTDASDGASEDSVKLTRSLTEKRKNYVRRVSSRVGYSDPKSTKSIRYRHQTSICSYKSEPQENPYSTFRSWKSFRASQSNLNNQSMDSDKINHIPENSLDLSPSVDTVDNMSVDEKTGCVDLALPFEPRENGLFNVCLVAGMNYMTGQAYVKSVFPKQVKLPPHIENLIFPETLSPARGDWVADAKWTQCYSLVLTDERGERAYGYCRRVLPEGAAACLPLCYCIIGKYRAPGFYYKVLQEIESHHGSSEVEINSILQQLFETDFPSPGEEISITYTNKQTNKRNSTHLDIVKCKTMPDPRRSPRSNTSVKSLEGTSSDSLPECYDLENNNICRRIDLPMNVARTKSIKQPMEPRVDEDCLSTMLDSLGAGLLIKVFGSLLLERKVLVVGDKLSVISSCLEGLQNSLYPFVWQQPLISVVPREIQREVLEAPLPILAGMLSGDERDLEGRELDEGMLIDLTHPSKVLYLQGDESTILPTSSYKALKNALQMESSKHKDREEDKKTRNLLISEAFLRFFTNILGDFWKFFSIGELKEGDLGKEDVIFDKEAFIKNASSKQNQYFLEWFTETAMFHHFVLNMAAIHHNKMAEKTTDKMADVLPLVDTPQLNYYKLLQDRYESKLKINSNVESKSNYKNAVNRKVKLLKSKLRDLVA